MLKYVFVLLLITFSLTACDSLKTKESTETKKKKPLEEEEEGQPKKKKKEIENGEDIKTNSNADILNNIIVHENGELKVSRAFLSFEDGRLVPKNNHAPLNTAVYLTLLIDGWTVQDGIVSLDAWEKIVTDKGELVLNAPHLFKKTPHVEESKASQITLQAGITRTRPDIKYFVVHYRIWDKNSKGEVKGSYKLYIDETSKGDF